MAMVRPSTQQTVDRILGTAVVISLSVVLVRRLLFSQSSSSSSHHYYPLRCEDDNDDDNHYRSRWRWWASYWSWPGGSSDSSVAGKRRKRDTQNKNGMEVILDSENKIYEHSGSCHCGSIRFLLQGTKRLRAIDTTGKIRFPHVSIPANRFQLVSGQDHMRFYYEDTITDDSSSITFDMLPGGGSTSAHSDGGNHRASCAFCFCGNCGVHVFHADRSSGILEINSNCLDGGEARLLYGEEEHDVRHASSSSSSSSKHTLHHEKSSSTKTCTIIETVSENEPFLGGTARLVYTHDNNDDHNNHTYNYTNCKEESNILLRTKESSMSSLDPTQPDTYSTAMMAESDDSSMASSSIAGGVSLTQYHSLLSVASSVGAAAPASSSSIVRERSVRRGLPPRPPSSLSSSSSRISPSNRSVTTLPPWLDGRPGGYYGSKGGLKSVGGGGSSWSVASIESHEFDGLDTSSTISPKMRDQMKKYLSSHMSKK